MQSLLRWSIENSTPLDSSMSAQPPATRKDLDPAIIDMILGRPDAELMKEDMSIAADPGKNEDERLNALDHLEMLVEQIDNANNLAQLRLWEPLHSLLTAPTSTNAVKVQALWVLGTAVQNNPSAQDAYLALHPLQTLVSFLTPSPSSTMQTRSKAIYTLSGLLKHNAPAVRELEDPNIDGWSHFREALQDPEISVRRKTIFLLATLLLPTSLPPITSSSHPSNLHGTNTPNEPVHDNSHAANIHDPKRVATSELTVSAFQTHGILEAVLQALVDPLPYGEDGDITEPDVTFEETGVRLLHTYNVVCKAPLEEKLRDELRTWVQAEREKAGGVKALTERWALDEVELDDLLAKSSRLGQS